MRFISGLTILSLVINQFCLICCAEDHTLPQPSRVLEMKRGMVLPSPTGTSAAVSAYGIKPYLLDVGSGEVKARLELPQGLQGGGVAYSSDGLKLAGVYEDRQMKDHILVWDASNGKLLQRAVIPDSALYVMSLRFSRNGAVVYAGARNELYEYNLAANRLTTLVRDVPYYVLDVAGHPDGKSVAYIEGQNEFGIHEWPRLKRDLPLLLRRQKERIENLSFLKSVDYTADGSEIAVAAVMNRGLRSGIFRFDAATGRLISQTIVSENIEKVRYIGDTQALLVQGQADGKRSVPVGCFGFLKPGSTELDDLRDTESDNLRDLESWLVGAAVDPGENGFVAVGLRNGKLMLWRRKDWPESWISIFRK